MTRVTSTPKRRTSSLRRAERTDLVPRRAQDRRRILTCYSSLLVVVPSAPAHGNGYATIPTRSNAAFKACLKRHPPAAWVTAKARDVLRVRVVPQNPEGFIKYRIKAARIRRQM